MNNIQTISYPSRFTCNLSTVNFNNYLTTQGNYNLLSNVPWNYSTLNSITTLSNVGIGKTNPSYSLDISGTINCQKLFINDSNIFDIYNSNLNIENYSIQTNGLLSNNYYIYSNDSYINFPRATTGSILLVGAGGRGGGFVFNDSNIITSNSSNIIISKNSYYQINNESLFNIEDGNYNIIFDKGSLILNNTNNNKYKLIYDSNNKLITTIAWYKFDDITNIGLDTHSSYNLTNYNSTSLLTNSVFGSYCASFNGTNQYLYIANNLGLNGTDFTISFWSYRFNNNRQESILQFGNIGTFGQRLIILYTTENYMDFGLYGKENNTIAYPNDANTWVHWVFCYNYTNRTIQIYRNGLSVYFDLTANYAINFNNNFYIGTNNQPGISNFNGLIDDLRIYNRELTSSNISDLYNTSINYTLQNKSYLTIDNNNPIAWYNFDNPSNIGFDTQNNYHLYNSNLTSISLNSSFGNYSGFFNGGSQYLYINNNLGLNGTDFTISFWVYRISNNRDESILQIGSINDLGQRLIILYTSQNYMNFGLFGKNNQTIAYPNDTNNWVHWCFSYNYTNRTIQIYRNGLSVYFDTTTNNPINFNNNFYIGTNNQSGVNNFIGLIDDLRIYKRQLWDYEIQKLYSKTTTIKSNIISNYITKNSSYSILYDSSNLIINPLVWYKFENSTNYLNDSSPNLNHLYNSNASYNENENIKGGNGSFVTDVSKYGVISKNINFYQIQTTTGFSYSFWIKLINKPPNWGSFFQINDTAGYSDTAYSGCGFNDPQNNLVFWLNNGISNSVIINNPIIVDKEWHHIVWTISSTGVWTIYIDNINQNVNKTVNFSSTGNYNAYKTIGYAHTASAYYVNAYFNDFRIYGIELNSTQVLNLYTTNVTNTINQSNYTTYFITKDNSYPVLKDLNNSIINPIIWYKFDTSSSSMLNDSGTMNISLNNINGTFDNINYTKGNGSIYFDTTTNTKVSLSKTPNFYNIQILYGISVSFWFKITNQTPNYANFFVFNATNNINNSGNYYIRTDSTNLAFGLWNSDYYNYITSGITYNNNSWYHIVWTISKTGVWNIYSNGNNLNVSVTRNFNSTASFGSAIRDIGSQIVGNIDDFRIYDFELSTSQALELYNGKVTIISPIYNNSGGGGIGDIIYYPNYNFNKGTYNIKIGKDSSTPILRDTYIYDSNLNGLIAKGGGDGEPTFNYIDSSITSIYNKTFKFGTYYNINNTTYKYLSAGTYNFIFNQGQLRIDNVYDYSYPVLFDTNNNIIQPSLWYKFNNSSNFLNDEYYSSNNLWSSNCSFDTSNFIKGSGSLAFNAQYSQFARVPNNLNLNTINTTTGISFSVWARFSTRTYSWGKIFDFGMPNPTNPTNGYSYIYIGINSRGGSLRFEIYNQGSGSTYDTSTANYRDGLWRHYTWTISTTGVWNIYINGEAILTNSTRIVIPTFTISSQFYYLGKSMYQDEYFDGNIDDFRIYSKVLSQTEVLKLFKGECKILTLNNNQPQTITTFTNTNITNDYVYLRDTNNNVINPIRWYKFDINGLLDDSIGNNIASLNGTNASTILTLDTTNFIKGNSSLNNTSVNYCYYKFALTNQPPISFCYWVNFNSFSSWCVFSYNSDNNISSLQMDITSLSSTSGFFYIYTALPSRWNTQLSGYSFQLYTNKWYFVTLTYGSIMTGSVVKLYINGILIATSTGSVGSQFPNIGTIYIGKSGDSSRGFDGKVDDVRVYDFELSQTQIQYLYSGNNYKINSNSLIKFNNEKENFIIKDNYNIINSNGNFAIGSFIPNIDTSYPILYNSNNQILNPILWYKFENSTNFEKDYLNNANNQLFNNKCQFHTSDFIKGSGSVYFDSSLYAALRIPNTIDFNSINKNKGISFSFWAKLNKSTTNWGRIIDFGQVYTTNPEIPSNYIRIARNGTSGSLNFRITRAPINANYGNLSYPYAFNEIYLQNFNYFDGVWRHFVWSISPTGEWSIYVNGIMVYNIDNQNIIPYFNPLYQYNFIGRTFERNQNANYYLNGNLDDFRIYDFVLTSNQVIELYNGNIKFINTDVKLTGGNYVNDINYNYTIRNNTSNLNIPLTSYLAFNYGDIIQINSNNYTINFNNGSTLVNNIYTSNSYAILKNNNQISLNPIVWYKFDNDSNNMLIDSGSSGSHLWNSNATFDLSNYIKGNGSINFSATIAQYARVPNTLVSSIPIILNQSGLSFSWWGKFGTGAVYYERVFDFGCLVSGSTTSVKASINCYRKGNSTDLSFGLYQLSPSILSFYNTSGMNFFNNVWNHIAWTISNTGVWNIYVNGTAILINTTYTNIPITAFTNGDLLGFIAKAIQETYKLEGNLDDFRIYDFVLTPTQVTHLYNSGINIYTNNSYPILKNNDLISLNPIVWYKFQDSNSYLIDNGLNSNNLILTGTIGASFDNSLFIKSNGSLNLGLNKSAITTNNIDFYNIQINNGITFSFWGKFSNSTPFSASILSIPNVWSSTAYVYIARNASTQNLEFNINNENTATNSIFILTVPNTSFFNDTWFHLTWSISRTGDWFIYINGINQIVSKNKSFNSTGGHNTKLTLGWAHTQTTYYVIGNIDDFRIYDFVLSSNQVQELYNGRVNIYYTTLDKSKGIDAYSSNINLFNLTLGQGGTGGTSNLIPIIKSNNYGFGGDGNNGNAGNGLVIIKINETKEDSIEFKGYVNWNNIINTTSNSLITINQNKEIKINYNSNNFYLDNYNILNISNFSYSNNDIIYSGNVTLTNNIYNFSNLFSNIPVKQINNNISIGIGITNPLSKLHLGYYSYSNSDILIKLTDNSTGHSIDNGFTIEKDNTQAGIIWNQQNTNIIFNSSNNIEIMRITSNGNIGIGTTNPSSALEIKTNFITTKRFDYRRSTSAAPTTAGNFAICYTNLLYNNNLSPSVITYTTNTATGDSFTINQKGMYSINAIIGNTYTNGNLFWLDKNELSTTNYGNNNILAWTSIGNYNHSSLLYTGLLNKNDVIRIKSTNIGNLIASANHTLTITLITGII